MMAKIYGIDHIRINKYQSKEKRYGYLEAL